MGNNNKKDRDSEYDFTKLTEEDKREMAFRVMVELNNNIMELNERLADQTDALDSLGDLLYTIKEAAQKLSEKAVSKAIDSPILEHLHGILENITRLADKNNDEN